MGPMRVKQPLPSVGLEQLSPFILLHHAGPDFYEPGKYQTRLGPHPHRGFEPVTFLFSGKAHHRDSMGNKGDLQSGGVQWMTAGSGIIHSEGPSDAFREEGGTLELIQLWVNLPRANKMTAPKYQDLPAEAIPEINEGGFKIKLVSGAYKDYNGPANTFTPILSMMLSCEREAELFIPMPASYNALVYVLDGTVKQESENIDKLNMIVYQHDGDGIQLKATQGSRLLLLAGEPIHEPIYSYGPFVMNYPAEIKQAILDYESGKMGSLDF
jgi:redox-sensitive bicupin YhaK (pirin superfamily)